MRVFGRENREVEGEKGKGAYDQGEGIGHLYLRRIECVGPNCTSYWVDCPVLVTDLTGIWKSAEMCEEKLTIESKSSSRKRGEQHARTQWQIL